MNSSTCDCICPPEYGGEFCESELIMAHNRDIVYRLISTSHGNVNITAEAFPAIACVKVSVSLNILQSAVNIVFAHLLGCSVHALCRLCTKGMSEWYYTELR